MCIANLNAIDALIDKDEKSSKTSIMEAIVKAAKQQSSKVANSSKP